MDNFGLYMILTQPAAGHVAAAEAAVACGIGMLQLREKHLPDGELLRLACELRAVTGGTGTRLIVNDRPDIALLCGADGVHVGQGDLPVDAVRRIVGPKATIGLSTHSTAQAREAMALSGLSAPDYIGFGPVYATTTKEVPDPVVGTAQLKDVLGFARLPVVAIGGIFPEKIASVTSTGAENICLVRYLMEPRTKREIEERIREVQERMR